MGRGVDWVEGEGGGGKGMKMGMGVSQFYCDLLYLMTSSHPLFSKGQIQDFEYGRSGIALLKVLKRSTSAYMYTCDINLPTL